ncbi:MAG: LEA type 2 family protein [Acidobacteria bacterium]|nr:LEA type 2 family protein [Acidobacteriota bacterium]
MRLPVRVSCLFVLAAVLAGASACVFFRRPEVVFRGISVRSLNADGANVEAALDVYNPNSYRISVQRLTYRATVEGREAGGGVVDAETVLESKQTTPVTLPLTLDWNKIKAAGFEALLMRSVDYAVEGEITFSTPVGTFHRPYRHAGRYAPFGTEGGRR